MSDLQKGQTFSGTSPNNVVTAEKLNSLVDNATILVGFYTGKTEETAMASGDFLLFYDTSTGEYKKIQVANAITAARGRPGATNLFIQNNLSTPDSKLDVTADYILMRNASNGNLRLATSFSQTADITLGVAVNGLDAGTEAANTWYYVYAISDGTNDRLLLSTSASSPTLPSGYTYSCLLGAVRNDGSSNFHRMCQRGNDVALKIPSEAGTASASLNPYTGSVLAEFTAVATDAANTFQAVNLSRCIPPTLPARVQGIIGHTTATNGTLRAFGVAGHSVSGTLISSFGTLYGACLGTTQVVTSQPPAFAFTAMMNFDVPVVVSQTIHWATNSNSNSTNNMRITGYTISLH